MRFRLCMQQLPLRGDLFHTLLRDEGASQPPRCSKAPAQEVIQKTSRRGDIASAPTPLVCDIFITHPFTSCVRKM